MEDSELDVDDGHEGGHPRSVALKRPDRDFKQHVLYEHTD